MKAITLWQPWATLIAIGAKRFETRSWGHAYRGPLAIHAGQKAARPSELGPMFRLAMEKAQVETLPRGAVLCVCSLRQIVISPARISGEERAQELAFGDHTPGRRLWWLSDVMAFRDPLHFKGAQGLWDWEPPENWQKLVVPVKRLILPEQRRRVYPSADAGD